MGCVLSNQNVKARKERKNDSKEISASQNEAKVNEGKMKMKMEEESSMENKKQNKNHVSNSTLFIDFPAFPESVMIKSKEDNKKKLKILQNKTNCMICDRSFSISRKPVAICNQNHNVCFQCFFKEVREAKLDECYLCYREFNLFEINFNFALLFEQELITYSEIEKMVEDEPKFIKEDTMPDDIGLRDTFYGFQHYKEFKEEERRHIFRQCLNSDDLRQLITNKTPFSAVRALNLSYCQITIIPILQDFPSIQILQLSHNKIRKIDVMEHLPLLIDLDLSYNQIKVIENLFLEGLLYLTLQCNRIQELYDFEVIQKNWLKNLKKLCLFGNPLKAQVKRQILMKENKNTKIDI